MGVISSSSSTLFWAVFCLPSTRFPKNPYSVFHDPAELSFSIKASADILMLPNDFLMTKIIAYTILYGYNVIIKGVVIIYWWGTGVLR